MALVYVVLGFGFLAVGIDDDLTGGAISLEASWASLAFAVVGTLWGFVGVRAILRRSRRYAQATDAELRGAILKTRSAGLLDLVVTAGLVTLLLDRDIGGDAITLDKWAPGVFGTIAVLVGLRGLIFFWPRRPAQLREYEAKEEAKETRERRLAELAGGGLPGRATVREVDQQGASTSSVLAEITFELTVEGRAPITSKWTGSVDMVHVGRLVPGQSVPIRAHPEDPTAFEVDWASPSR